MSDDEADPELLELLRQRLGISSAPVNGISPNTNVLHDAEFINNNAVDVFIDMYGTKSAAASIHRNMQSRGYSTGQWGEHELHPTTAEGFGEVDIVNFVFTMDLLNFSFWSERPDDQRFQVNYRERQWKGYTSLVACLRRALDDGIPITTPRFWRSPQCTDELLAQVFRSSTSEPMPLLNERMTILRDASVILFEDFSDAEDGDSENEDYADPVAGTGIDAAAQATPQAVLPSVSATAESQSNSPPVTTVQTQGTEIKDSEGEAVAQHRTAATEPKADKTAVEACDTKLDATGTEPDHHKATSNSVGPDRTVVRMIERASHSAGKLVNLLAKHFPTFRDETRFEGRSVRFLKRAQIFVADVWAALNGTGCGEFHDIDHLTMFADYRVPQVLHSLGVLRYSPPLEYHVSALKHLHPGHPWEVQLRGCSIWAVELIRREIHQAHPGATVNAVLIDFFLYDLAKEREASGFPAIAHHRVRSQWY